MTNAPFRLGVPLLLALLLTLPADAATRGLDEYDVAALSAVIEASISPDGQHIAYVRLVPRRPFADEDGGSWMELHVVDAAGKRSRPFVTGHVSVHSVAWTPDGRGIAFLAKRGRDQQTSLYVIPLGGGEARRVLEHETGVGAFSFHPSGSQVAFLAQDPEPAEEKRLADSGFDQRVVEEGQRFTRVWIAGLTDGARAPRKLAIDGSVSHVAWSHDGQKLAVAVAPTPSIDDTYMKRRVMVVEPKAGKVLGKVDTQGKLGWVPFVWSPDSRHLALIASEDQHDPAAGRLVVAPVRGGKPRELLPGAELHVRAVAWRDAKTLLYLADERVWTKLAEVDIDGKNERVWLAPGSQPVFLGTLAVAGDGKTAALIGETPAHPLEAFSLSLGEPPKRLTDGNPWLAERRFGAQEVVTWKARDGLELDGVLIRPIEGKKKPAPLILSVHGGPEANHRNGFMTRYSRPAQVAAARGFAVFFPNYRGSTGRGAKFSKLGQADAAGKEFDDLVDAVDHLVKVGVADPKRIGVTGGSYGGYATAWLATRYSDRFQAGVMFAGISDKLSKTGTTDIPNEENLVHARRWPWEAWQEFLERSPIYHVTKARTPLLILHGERDPRVHPTQAMELHRYLKTLGKAPVRLVLYRGEGHGNRRAASRLDLSLRLMRWFEHYLKGRGGDPPPRLLKYREK